MNKDFRKNYVQQNRYDNLKTNSDENRFNENWFNEDWIKERLNEEAVKCIDKALKYLKNISTSQIRNFFGEVKRIQLNVISRKKEEQAKAFKENEQSFLLLKARLAYMKGRANTNKEEIEAFTKIMNQAISVVLENNISDEDKLKRFKNFCDFFECILAYHKYHGGK